MTQFVTSILDTVGGVLSSPYVQLAGRAIFVYVVILWLASAYWAYRDLETRSVNPLAPYLAAIVIIVFTPVFFLLGLLLYRIVRPSETIAEANERALAEEAMLAEVEGHGRCAVCHRRVDADWLVCPTCRNQLRASCPNCNGRTDLDWLACAWCGHDLVPQPVERRSTHVPGIRLPRRRQATPLPTVAADDRSLVSTMLSAGAPDPETAAHPAVAAPPLRPLRRGSGPAPRSGPGQP